ncbi:MAG: 4-hydroxy-tetrahydrodipicolinate reductase, partial [Thermodesulfobacteriota bacterium]|nr:4-hydroxy-tetrahydrodipicolinate reductase [Thermodesulfobacteriota bacterium]
MTGVIVAGAAGRMGGRIMQAVLDYGDLELAGAFERPEHPELGRDAGLAAGLGEIGIKLAGSLGDVLEAGEVIIDFTQPEATLGNLEQAAKTGKAMVVGTTGFSAEETARIHDLSGNMRLVLAPNMSVGVNLLFKIVGDVAQVLKKGYDLEIVEAHHRLKKDAPSGTAMRLAEILAETTGRSLNECAVYGRQGIIGERPDDEIAVLSVRAGDIVGEHTVTFGGIGERLEITHRAHSRDTFARGAVRAASWIVNQSPGLYD